MCVFQCANEVAVELLCFAAMSDNVGFCQVFEQPEFWCSSTGAEGSSSHRSAVINGNHKTISMIDVALHFILLVSCSASNFTTDYITCVYNVVWL